MRERIGEERREKERVRERERERETERQTERDGMTNTKGGESVVGF